MCLVTEAGDNFSQLFKHTRILYPQQSSLWSHDLWRSISQCKPISEVCYVHSDMIGSVWHRPHFRQSVQHRGYSWLLVNHSFSVVGYTLSWKERKQYRGDCDLRQADWMFKTLSRLSPLPLIGWVLHVCSTPRPRELRTGRGMVFVRPSVCLCVSSYRVFPDNIHVLFLFLISLFCQKWKSGPFTEKNAI